MKRFILALVMIVFAVAAFSQSAINTATVKGYYHYTGTDANADTLTDTGTIIRYFNVNRDDIYLYRFEVDMDETSGTSGCHTLWAGSLDGVAYTDIGVQDTLTADGTTVEQDLSTGIVYRYLRLTVTGYGTTTWDMDEVKIKIVGKND